MIPSRRRAVVRLARGDRRARRGAGRLAEVLGKLCRVQNAPEPARPMSRLTDGGTSSQANGACGATWTRRSRTALTRRHAASVRTRAPRSGSSVTIASGSQATMSSSVARRWPSPRPAATLRAPRRFRLSMSSVSSPSLRGRSRRAAGGRGGGRPPWRRRRRGCARRRAPARVPVGCAEQVTEERIRARDRRELAVEHQVGELRLALHPVGKRPIRRAQAAVVEHEVGADLPEQGEVGPGSRTTQLPDDRQAGEPWQQVTLLLGREPAWPPDRRSGASVYRRTVASAPAANTRSMRTGRFTSLPAASWMVRVSAALWDAGVVTRPPASASANHRPRINPSPP